MNRVDRKQMWSLLGEIECQDFVRLIMGEFGGEAQSIKVKKGNDFYVYRKGANHETRF